MSQFDVFLAHNSLDRPQVKAIAEELERRGLKPWLDDEQIPPGHSFQDEIQQAIPVVKSAAIFIGSQGLGRWQNWELKTFISRCVEKKIPVIPVLLPGVSSFSEDLVFLREIRWIEFSKQVDDEKALDLLEWGITGRKPQKNLQLNDKKPGQIPQQELLEEIDGFLDDKQTQNSEPQNHQLSEEKEDYTEQSPEAVQKFQYDVALSFAGEDRKYAENLAQVLRDYYINVFYDEYEEATLWGKNLYTHLSDVYQKKARFCVMFLSQHYAKKLWTNHERQAAQARAFQEKEVYILPIRLDNTEIPGILPTIGYLQWSNADLVANAIVQKLKEETPRQLQLEVFKFETVKLYIEGNSIKSVTLPHQANYFIEDLGFGVTLKMIEIPGGTFIMGASTNEKGSRDNERPMHQVIVKPFFMGKYLITQKQWNRVASSFPKVKRELDPRPSNFRGDGCLPVEQVSWFDAVEFCNRLAKKTSRNYHLPSEAQWEYACRAGTTTPFSFGETITTNVANYNGNIIYGNSLEGVVGKKTTLVGNFLPNDFGLHDMHGNLLEWCEDFLHKNYEGAPTDGSAWLNNNDNQFRILRGGSWFKPPDNCRSAYRAHYYPDGNDNEYGFRVVCSGNF